MLQQLLEEQFGFKYFGKGQKEVITKITNRESAIAIFPTGSGKSLCYQLPALTLPNLTLVVSPLLALIQDQLDFLRSKNISAVRIDSSLSREEEVEVMKGIKENKHKVLMISVERFKNERFRRFLKEIPISLLVVDEAHCISEWGHNFRPDYLKLPAYQKEFNIEQSLLLTATATPRVIEDMCKKFNIGKENVTVTGFYRSNLNLQVLPVKQTDKNQILVDLLSSKKEDASIIYVTLQKTAENVAKYLSKKGVTATAYHAGLKTETRESIQNSFMKSEINCVVATIAFGMGIDKSNIRNVIHYDLPKSIENYSQEIGRAGRDNQPANCIVLANRDNVNILENFVYGDTPEYEGIKKLLEIIQSAGEIWDVRLIKIPALCNIRMLPIKTLLVYLEIMGILKPLNSYYATYRFTLNVDDKTIINKFKGERKEFIQEVFDTCNKARKWWTVDFDNIKENPKLDRQRIIAALEYFSEQGWLILEASQMADVFSIKETKFDVEKLAKELFDNFKLKEGAEVKRIENMIALFESNTCLSTKLAAYFGEKLPIDNCGHCSVCSSGAVKIAQTDSLPSIENFNFEELTQKLIDSLKGNESPELITKFLCGIYTPKFTTIKAKSMPGFGKLERYRYQDILNWVKESL
ncbi:ATP-dependent DNA helicase RecQ [Ancylomarina sp. 16SWW S1-10-2]|uniref:RecQ family ATP-dependent DNA helicase n=1 Tax=Ancylomarina sp. 16SWW S1-10-2 TaxID=2499681 RepID=UPI0012ADF859|nr:RecQ family ATP-dependent DNA helicase [Ancylomarina sp. 16SWW S1-10-2]MRT93613.1 RecQ family ATP-dependent DNA helicase [Ancylomarina sp. 16SWW S1-10-2]